MVFGDCSHTIMLCYFVNQQHPLMVAVGINLSTKFNVKVQLTFSGLDCYENAHLFISIMTTLDQVTLDKVAVTVVTMSDRFVPVERVVKKQDDNSMSKRTGHHLGRDTCTYRGASK